MPKSTNQKLKILYLMKILNEKTDEFHSMSMNEIIEQLEKQGIKAERKSIYNDLEMLEEFGIDVHRPVKSKTEGYYIGDRDFELPELKLLVDAVQCSRFITQKKSNKLIKKLEKLTSNYEAVKLQRYVYISDRVKCLNESIYYNIDKLHNAITENKKVTFKYFDYTIEKQRKFRKNGDIYIESPYALSWNNENYYLIAFSEKYHDYVHYRVDRMTEIEVIDEVRTKLPENEVFNAADYMKTFFSMYSGEEKSVVMQFDNSLIDVVIDRFGKDIEIRKQDDRSFIIRAKISVSSTFFAWIFQFGNMVKILSPQDVLEDYKKSLKEAMDMYLK